MPQSQRKKCKKIKKKSSELIVMKALESISERINHNRKIKYKFKTQLSRSTWQWVYIKQLLLEISKDFKNLTAF